MKQVRHGRMRQRAYQKILGSTKIWVKKRSKKFGQNRVSNSWYIWWGLFLLLFLLLDRGNKQSKLQVLRLKTEVWQQNSQQNRQHNRQHNHQLVLILRLSLRHEVPVSQVWSETRMLCVRSSTHQMVTTPSTHLYLCCLASNTVQSIISHWATGTWDKVQDCNFLSLSFKLRLDFSESQCWNRVRD